MTPRENLLRIFRHETPEWIPIVGHVDPYNQPSRERMPSELAEALGKVEWHDGSTVTFSRYLGIDIMDYMGPPLRSKRRNVAVDSVQSGEDAINTWHTPRGDLREVRRRCREDGTSYVIEHMVKGPEDLPALAAVFEDEEFEVDLDGVRRVKSRRALIGEGGMLTFFMPGTPMGMMYRQYSGVETLAYLWADAPRALGDLLSIMEKSHLEQFRLAAQFDADALVGMDDTSTTVISPAMFEESGLGYTDRVSDIAHRAGRLYFHHSCGLIRDLLDLYRRTEMDAVHAFTVPPVGDVTIAEGRRMLGDRITIIAGLKQLAGPMDDREAVRSSVREMFGDAGPGDHLVLWLAAYPDKTVDQTQFLLEQCRKYQRLLGT